MIEDKNLTRTLLKRLSEIEASLPQGASVAIQPSVEGMYVANPLKIPGYDGKQIEFHLLLLLQQGFIDTGGVTGGPGIGIQFSRLTEAGHHVLMYRPPTIFDFQRNLDTLIHGGEHQARAAAAQVKSDHSARGLRDSTTIITMAIGKFDEIHKDICARAMQLIHDFAARSTELTPAVLGGTARPRLDSFATFLLGTIPPTTFAQEAQRFRHQYTQVFRQRLDGALRDIEIGFIGGRDVTATPTPAMVLNNIRVDNSVVGSINTSNVQAIDVSLTNLHNAGNDKARDALKALTEAILGDTSTGDTQKNELVEQVAFLSEQAVVSAKDRKPGLVKATFGALTQAAGTVSAMAGAWQAAEPILKSVFGL